MHLPAKGNSLFAQTFMANKIILIMILKKIILIMILKKIILIMILRLKVMFFSVKKTERGSSAGVGVAAGGYRKARGDHAFGNDEVILPTLKS